MRIFVSLTALFSLAIFSLQGASAEKEKPKATHGKTQLSAPKIGVKTPGVQISFANLKSEAEFETGVKADWLFFSTSLFAPGLDTIAKFDPKTNKKAEPLAGLNKPCGGMVSAFGSLWAPVCSTSSLARIDAKTFKITATIPAGVANVRGAIAASADSIWLLTDDKGTLSRIDPDQNAVVGELRVPVGCRGMTFGETALWLACPNENKVLRINPATGLIEKTIDVSAQPEALAIGEGSVWALCRKEGKIDRIDPKTNKVSKTIELGVPGADGAIAFGEGYLWVTQQGFPLARIDVKSETVAQQFSGAGGGAIAVSTGAIWLSNLNTSTIWRIDPRRVIATLSE